MHSAIEAIYDAALVPAGWPCALQKIADCLDDVGTVMLFGKEDGSYGVVASPSILPMTEEYLRDWSHRDVRAIRGRERGYFLSGEALTDRHVLTEQEMDVEPHYCDFLAKYDLRYFAAIVISPNPKIDVIISVQRRRDRPPYSDDELSLLSHLSRHVERALALGIKLLDGEIIKEGLAEALSRVGHGILVLGGDGEILFRNAVAEALLGDGLGERQGRLYLYHEPAQRRFRAALAEFDLAPSAVSQAVVVPRKGDARLVLRLMPLAWGREAFLANARHIAFITDVASDGVIEPDLLREMFGLTKGEARLAALVGAGNAPSAVATRLGITPQTARSVLKRVFEKVGVSRQAELVGLFSRLVMQP